MLNENVNDGDFVRISNKDIYKKLCCIEEKVIKINGSIKLNKWIASTALALSLASIGYIIRLVV